MSTKIKRDKQIPISPPVVLLILFILSTAITKQIKPDLFQANHDKVRESTSKVEKE